jgi:oligoendopeptidase F
MLMNFNGDFESVSTLSHEFGHAMHSYLSKSAQPYPTADYSIFVAELASTSNEALLIDYMLKNAKTDDERLFFLGNDLERIRGTYFRQAMFGEFELQTHDLVDKGEALTGTRFTEIYGDLLRRYHGHDQGVLKIDDLYTVEWAYIPHFYYNFTSINTPLRSRADRCWRPILSTANPARPSAISVYCRRDRRNILTNY